MDNRMIQERILEMNSVSKWLVVILGVVVALVACAFETKAQSHEGFLYGTVHLHNGKTYTGPIRWGNEEVLWTDLFNVAKSDNQYKKLVPKDKDNDDSWFDNDWSLTGIWANKMVIHKFSCQFGNLSRIELLSKARAKIIFKHGGELMVDGEGYNDMGTVIQVIDPELGTMKLDWDKISKIEFAPTPEKVEGIFGMPLYGTVEGARREKYTGYIVWDNDERLNTDKLDGESDDGDVSIRFGDIASIERVGRGSQVVTRSGRELHLTGTNDVNDGNRGVLVVVPDVGVIHFSWDAFKKVTLHEPKIIQSYTDFKTPAMLKGTVRPLDGPDLKGRIIYDIDETLNIEVLEGSENDIEYVIPMKNIKKITPKNEDFSSITLRNGDTYLLGNSQDVSSRNGGVLVFIKGKKAPEYVRWKQINEIIFE
jgi:hypothetical protein